MIQLLAHGIFRKTTGGSLNPQFQQPQKVVSVDVNKQSIARDFGVKHGYVERVLR